MSIDAASPLNCCKYLVSSTNTLEQTLRFAFVISSFRSLFIIIQVTLLVAKDFVSLIFISPYYLKFSLIINMKQPTANLSTPSLVRYRHRHSSGFSPKWQPYWYVTFSATYYCIRTPFLAYCKRRWYLSRMVDWWVYISCRKYPNSFYSDESRKGAP